MLVEDQKLDAVIKLPAGAFRPYSGVSTAILLFTKTNSGGTDHVWFYDVQADGLSLDDKRAPLLPDDQLGAVLAADFVVANHAKNNLPDVVDRWAQRDSSERHRSRTAQSFSVPKGEIAAQSYDLSLNRYREVVHDEVDHRAPAEIIADIEVLEDEIRRGLDQLKAMLG
jgi:type I restriction enzyme M protein